MYVCICMLRLNVCMYVCMQSCMHACIYVMYACILYVFISLILEYFLKYHSVIHTANFEISVFTQMHFPTPMSLVLPSFEFAFLLQIITRISFFSSSRDLTNRPLATTIPSEAALLTALTRLYQPRFLSF